MFFYKIFLKHVFSTLVLAGVSFFYSACCTAQTHATAVLIDDFTAPSLNPTWQEKSFVGKTLYTLSVDQNLPCLKAVSSGTASGLFAKTKIAPKDYPFLSWKWKIEKTLAKGNGRRKDGDDYAARIYVVFKSFFFWQTKAINYIWANTITKGEAIPNAYTANAMMVAVESGNTHAGKWISETRNIYEDYQRFFGKEVPEIEAVAIMTDTDNTGERAVACYGPIFFSRTAVTDPP